MPFAKVCVSPVNAAFGMQVSEYAPLPPLDPAVVSGAGLSSNVALGSPSLMSSGMVFDDLGGGRAALAGMIAMLEEHAKSTADAEPTPSTTIGKAGPGKGKGAAGRPIGERDSIDDVLAELDGDGLGSYDEDDDNHDNAEMGTSRRGGGASLEMSCLDDSLMRFVEEAGLNVTTANALAAGDLSMSMCDIPALPSGKVWDTAHYCCLSTRLPVGACSCSSCVSECNCVILGLRRHSSCEFTQHGVTFITLASLASSCSMSTASWWLFPIGRLPLLLTHPTSTSCRSMAVIPVWSATCWTA